MYLVRVIKDGEVILATQVPEHPPEDFLRKLIKQADGDFADVCRDDVGYPSIPLNHDFI